MIFGFWAIQVKLTRLDLKKLPRSVPSCLKTVSSLLDEEKNKPTSTSCKMEEVEPDNK